MDRGVFMTFEARVAQGVKPGEYREMADAVFEHFLESNEARRIMTESIGEQVEVYERDYPQARARAMAVRQVLVSQTRGLGSRMARHYGSFLLASSREGNSIPGRERRTAQAYTLLVSHAELTLSSTEEFPEPVDTRRIRETLSRTRQVLALERMLLIAERIHMAKGAARLDLPGVPQER